MLECKDIDSLMMDQLYGELGPRDEVSFEEHLRSCSRCESELASLQRARSAFADLPEEEPPQSITAILMHEAAKQAPTRGVAVDAIDASVGRSVLTWISSLFDSVVSHPATVAFATLVLVAGIAGSLYLRGHGGVAQPLAPSGVSGNGSMSSQLAPNAAATADRRTAAGDLASTIDGEKGVGLDFETRGNEGGKGQRAQKGYAVDVKEIASLADAPADEGATGSLARDEQKRLKDRVAPREQPGPAPAKNISASRGRAELALDGTAAPSRKARRARGANATRGVPARSEANAVSGADGLVDADDDSPAMPIAVNSPPPPPPESVVGGRGQDTAGASAREPAPSQTASRTNRAGKKKGRLQQGAATERRADNSKFRVPATGVADKAAEFEDSTTSAHDKSADSSSRARAQKETSKWSRRWAQGQQGRLNAAARRKSCRDAARIANDILDRNPDYYYDKVRESKSVKQCSGFVQTERRRRATRRSRLRAKRKSAAAKSDKASPAKTKARPAKADSSK